ncbi:hypothetical protein ACLBWZ_16470 [Brucellaceae bacterium C25G]
MAMEENKSPANRFNELPEETQKFLTGLRGDDLVMLRDGLRLVGAMQTMGKFMKWVIVVVGGTFIGGVLLYENLLKVTAWLGWVK